MITTNENHVGVHSRHFSMSRTVFFVLLAAIIAAAVFRSAVSTRLDSFTFDEAYHIGSGVSYVKTGDFRLNPEQPPLTKVWTGAYVSLFGYNLSEFRSFSDKDDEREWVEDDAYVNNDPFALQLHARTAMLALNALLIFLLSLAVRRIFGDIVALASAAFLAIDPTVAAHMPVVMTDLPVALASGIAIMTAAQAFRTWKPSDAAIAALGLGLALSAKHSGIITLVAVALIGLVIALFIGRGVQRSERLKRIGLAAAVVLGGIVVLWSFYGFRYYETPGTSDETFNRGLAEKISDVRAPVFRKALEITSALHIFPRAYTWGLADTIRAGVDGRAIQVRAFGTSYYSKAPIYFFPGIVAAKLPLGILLLSITGLMLLAFRRLPREFLPTFAIVAAFSGIFLLFLIRGSSYAGIRHALPLFPLMMLLAAFAVYAAVISRSYIFGAGVGLLMIAAMVSAVPQTRPWEYFNELAGGAENGYKYFNDEGVDLSQRVKEMADFYHAGTRAKRRYSVPRILL